MNRNRDYNNYDINAMAMKQERIQRNFTRSVTAMIVGLGIGLIAGAGMSPPSDGAGFYLFTSFLFTLLFGGAICLFLHLRIVVISFNILFCIIFLIVALLGGFFVGVPLFIYDIVRYVLYRRRAHAETGQNFNSVAANDDDIVVTITAMDGHIYQADLLSCFTAGKDNKDYCAVLSHEEYVGGSRQIQLFRYTLTANNDGTENIELESIPSQTEYEDAKTKFESILNG